jgi:hypothetical protein
LKLSRISGVIPRSPNWPTVFACLSSSEAALESIVLKTRLTEKDVRTALEEMEQAGLASHNKITDRYLAGSPNVHFDGISGVDDSYFKITQNSRSFLIQVSVDRINKGRVTSFIRVLK